MGSVGTYCTSGNWYVAEGNEEAFVAAWSDLVQWTKENFDGAGHVQLLQEETDPRHFISVGEWDGADTVNRWRAAPEFAEKLGVARDLCDDFAAKDYTVKADFG